MVAIRAYAGAAKRIGRRMVMTSPTQRPPLLHRRDCDLLTRPPRAACDFHPSAPKRGIARTPSRRIDCSTLVISTMAVALVDQIQGAVVVRWVGRRRPGLTSPEPNGLLVPSRHASPPPLPGGGCEQLRPPSAQRPRAGEAAMAEPPVATPITPYTRRNSHSPDRIAPNESAAIASSCHPQRPLTPRQHGPLQQDPDPADVGTVRRPPKQFPCELEYP
jgi:hypothetical protein